MQLSKLMKHTQNKCILLHENYTSLKDPDARRAWGQEEKGTTEDEMAGWHHRLDGRGFG